MLIYILLPLIVWAAPSSREHSKQALHSACLRSEVHADADKRRVICNCIVRDISANKNLSDNDVEYLAKTWATPDQKIEPAPKEADILEEFDQDVMESCIENPGGKEKAKPETSSDGPSGHSRSSRNPRSPH